MAINITIAKTARELADGRQLNYEYIAHVGSQPILRQYFLAQNFSAEIDKMPQGYESPDGVFLVAYVDEVCAGTVAVRRLDRTTCEMKRLYVRPGFLGLGLGKQLCERALAEAKRLGYLKMRLDNSRSVMAKANDLYRSLGFYEITPYNNNNFVDDACFMEKVL